jgi:hypothetical protein
MLDKVKNKSSGPRSDIPPHLQRGQARHQDRAASRQLKKATEKKARTVATLKRLKMALED